MTQPSPRRLPLAAPEHTPPIRVKKQLYASLWKSCDELRGGMDASHYKDYILVLLFLKYISDSSTASGLGLGLEVSERVSFNDVMNLPDRRNGEWLTALMNKHLPGRELTE